MSEIKVIGRIDLDEYLRKRKVPVRDGGVFKVMEIRSSFYGHEPITLDFGESLDAEQSKGGYFTLLLGKNGVCKSSLFRELIEFFIDARGRSKRVKKSHVEILYVKYTIDEHIYEIEKLGSKLIYSKDGIDVLGGEMEYPLIVASTMGMFDKFPINSKPAYNNGRYNPKFYRYVGPKASSNMFTSKANVLLQQLSSLPQISRADQLEMLSVILRFIGYDPVLTIRFEAREPNARSVAYSSESLSGEHQYYYETICDGQVHSIDISFTKDSFDAVRSLPINSLYLLRQIGLVKNVHCCFYNKGEKVDADHLSSGEFNLLSIVTSVVLAAGTQRLLLLLDEPEISQHPNWQLDLIPNLEKALVDYGCHFLIATHCHFLVSNLPLKRSNVICLTRNEQNEIKVENIPSETYGWSADEVLLKAFGVPTDRNRYLAEMVSGFLKRIGEKSIERKDVENNLEFFRETSRHLSTYDPLKKILDTILKEFAV